MENEKYKNEKIKKISKIDTAKFEDLQEFDKLLEDLKTFDLYILFLMMKNEMLKRGFEQ